MIDFALAPTINGYYDLYIKDSSVAETDTFLTAILLTLFGEQRALESEVDLPEYRRGWWGDLLNNVNHKFGSKVWFLNQTRSSNTLLSFLITHLEEKLRENFVSDGLVSSVSVDGVRRGDIIRLTIEFKISNSLESIMYNTWINLESDKYLIIQKGIEFPVLAADSGLVTHEGKKLLINKQAPTSEDFDKLLLISTAEEVLTGNGEVVQYYLVTEGSNNIISY